MLSQISEFLSKVTQAESKFKDVVDTTSSLNHVISVTSTVLADRRKVINKILGFDLLNEDLKAERCNVYVKATEKESMYFTLKGNEETEYQTVEELHSAVNSRETKYEVLEINYYDPKFHFTDKKSFVLCEINVSKSGYFAEPKKSAMVINLVSAITVLAQTASIKENKYIFNVCTGIDRLAFEEDISSITSDKRYSGFCLLNKTAEQETEHFSKIGVSENVGIDSVLTKVTDKILEQYRKKISESILPVYTKKLYNEEKETKRVHDTCLWLFKKICDQALELSANDILRDNPASISSYCTEEMGTFTHSSPTAQLTNASLMSNGINLPIHEYLQINKATVAATFAEKYDEITKLLLDCLPDGVGSKAEAISAFLSSIKQRGNEEATEFLTSGSLILYDIITTVSLIRSIIVPHINESLELFVQDPITICLFEDDIKQLLREQASSGNIQARTVTPDLLRKKLTIPQQILSNETIIEDDSNVLDRQQKIANIQAKLLEVKEAFNV